MRSGRMSPGKRDALATLYGRHGLDVVAPSHDWASVFPGASGLHVEIGFGSGEEAAAFAAAHPDQALVGFEVYPSGVASALRRIEAAGLRNLKVARCDARGPLGRWFAKGSLAGVRVFFPDPWPKKRHRKRRLVNAGFVSEVAGLLRAGATFHFATDWAEYAEQALAHVQGEDALELVSFGTGEGHRHGRQVTRFEERGLREGRAALDLLARRQ